MEYKQLPEIYRKKGWDYELIVRGNRAVVYSGASDGEIMKYEVFLIKKHDGRKFGELAIPPSEYFPGDEQFGIWAWCFSAQSRGKYLAMQRFEELESGNRKEEENDEPEIQEEEDATD